MNLGTPAGATPWACTTAVVRAHFAKRAVGDTPSLSRRHVETLATIAWQDAIPTDAEPTTRQIARPHIFRLRRHRTNSQFLVCHQVSEKIVPPVPPLHTGHPNDLTVRSSTRHVFPIPSRPAHRARSARIWLLEEAVRCASWRRCREDDAERRWEIIAAPDCPLLGVNRSNFVIRQTAEFDPSTKSLRSSPPRRALLFRASVTI